MVAAHHVHTTDGGDDSYEDQEYCYLAASQAGHFSDLLEVDDLPGLTYSPEASGDDSFGSK